MSTATPESPCLNQCVRVPKRGTTGYISQIHKPAGQRETYIEVTLASGEKVWPLTTRDIEALE